MKKRGFVILLFFSLILLVSCAIEDFNSVPNLNTPLALGAVYTTNTITNIVSSVTNITNYGVIRLQFWAMNNENFFDGYEIFIADNLVDLTNETGSYRVLPNANGETNTADTNALSITAAPMVEALIFTYNMHYDTNLVSLLDSQTYYIKVKAYSFTFNSYSLPSNWTNATYFDY